MAILSVPPWSRRVSLPALLRRPVLRDRWRVPGPTPRELDGRAAGATPRKLTRFSEFAGSFQVPRIPNPAANPIPAPIRIRFQLTALRIVLRYRHGPTRSCRSSLFGRLRRGRPAAWRSGGSSTDATTWPMRSYPYFRAPRVPAFLCSSWPTSEAAPSWPEVGVHPSTCGS